MSNQHSLANTSGGGNAAQMLQSTMADRTANEWQQRSTYSAPTPVGDYPTLIHPETPQDERIRMKGLLADAGGNKVQRVMPYGEEELAYMQQLKTEAEQAEFDRWLSRKFDPHEPGQLRWLMSIAPDYVQRRVEQMKTDLELEQWDRMLKSFGVDSKEDLQMQHLLEKQKVKMRNNYLGTYQAGMFSQPLLKAADGIQNIFTVTPGSQSPSADALVRQYARVASGSLTDAPRPDPNIYTEMQNNRQPGAKNVRNAANVGGTFPGY